MVPWFIPVLLIALYCGGGEARGNDTIWHFDKPADDVTQGLLVGDGDVLTARARGGALDETIAFDNATLWSAGPAPIISAPDREILPQVRGLISARRRQEAAELFDRHFSASDPPGEPLAMGRLRIRHHGARGDNVTEYSRDLNMETAMTHVSYRVDGVEFRREVFAPRSMGVLVTQLTCDRPGSLTLSVWLESDRAGATSASLGANQLAIGAGPEGGETTLEWQARLMVETEGGKTYFEGDPARPICIRVVGAARATLFLATATNRRAWNEFNAKPGILCEARLLASALPFDFLRRDHIERHRQLFRACRLEMGDGKEAQQAARSFQYGRYLLLAGPFAMDGPWRLDGAFQARWWPAETCNLPETNRAFVDFMKDLSASGKETASTLYNCRGWVAHRSSDLWMRTAPGSARLEGPFPIAGAWLCRQLWRHFEFDPDREYLTEIYPILKDAARFYLDFLIEEPVDKHLQLSPSSSPGSLFRMFPDDAWNALCVDSTFDAAVLREFFIDVAQASLLLEAGEETFRKELDKAAWRLAPDRVDRQGRVQEWSRARESNAASTAAGLAPLYGVFPGKRVTIDREPKIFNAARRTLEPRRVFPEGWAGAWEMALWARLGDGDRALEILRRMGPALRPGDSEEDAGACLGAAAGVAEMLIQSHADAIEFLPALPAAWTEGRAYGLRARGGFEADIEWEKGRFRKAIIRSKSGGPCRARYTIPLPDETGGDPGTIMRRSRKFEIDFATKAGETYTIEPDEEFR